MSETKTFKENFRMLFMQITYQIWKVTDAYEKLPATYKKC